MFKTGKVLVHNSRTRESVVFLTRTSILIMLAPNFLFQFRDALAHFLKWPVQLTSSIRFI